ncbi:MAG: 30S ribosomal protein S12 methylthiotransferase RimO, partial [Methylobacter sp.]
VPEELKQKRLARFMAHQAEISAELLQKRVGHIETVLIDEVVEEGAVARSKADAPEIDGQVFIDGAVHLKVGDFVDVELEEADEYDLWGRLI